MEFLAKDRTTREDDIMAEWDTADIVWQAEKMAKVKHKIHAKAKLNIEAAQEKDICCIPFCHDVIFPCCSLFR